jgi:hypothetical protein
MIKFRNSPAAPSSAAIEVLETRLGLRLPDDYRHFLLTFNGGRPTPGDFVDKRDASIAESFHVDWLYGMCEGDPDIDLERHIMTFKGRMPGNIIPIGSDSCGNQVCVSASGDDCGVVYFWEMEKEADPDEGETPSYDNLGWVADSFADFLRGFEE